MRESHYHLLIYDTEGRLYDVRRFLCSKKQVMIYCDVLLTDVISSSEHVPYLCEVRVRSKSKHYPNGSRLIGLFRRSCEGLEEVKIHV